METFDIETFRSAAPYIYAHQGNVFVITIPYSMLESEQLDALVQDLALMQTLGIKLVLVYATGLFSKNRKSPPVIDERKLTRLQHKIGVLQSRLESLFSTGLVNTPMAGMKLTTISGNFVHAKPSGVVNGVDLQYHGEVRRIDTQAILNQLNNGNIVLLSSCLLYTSPSPRDLNPNLV